MASITVGIYFVRQAPNDRVLVTINQSKKLGIFILGTSAFASSDSTSHAVLLPMDLGWVCCYFGDTMIEEWFEKWIEISDTYIKSVPSNGYEIRKGICDYIYLGADTALNEHEQKPILMTKPGLMTDGVVVVYAGLLNERGQIPALTPFISTNYYTKLPDTLRNQLIMKRQYYSSFNDKISGCISMADLPLVSFRVDYSDEESNVSLKYKNGVFVFNETQVPQSNVTSDAIHLLLDVVNFINNNVLEDNPDESRYGYTYTLSYNGSHNKFYIKYSWQTPRELNIFHYKLARLVEALGFDKEADYWRRCSGAFPIKQQLEEMTILNEHAP